jgi:rubrerythrin
MIDQPPILKLLSNNELLLHGLYRVYAEKFLEFHDFWIKISQEEVDHANWIEQLSDQSSDGSLFINVHRFHSEAIKLFSDHIKIETEKALSGNVSAQEAIGIALDMEKALIEHKFFEVFQADGSPLKELLDRLAASTNSHIIRLQELLTKINA